MKIDIYNIFDSIIIFLGAIIMAANIIKYFKFSGKFTNINKSLKNNIYFMNKLYIFLLAFFLIGYIFTGCAFFYSIPSVGTYAVAAVFLFGSLFVYFGLKVQINLVDVVENSNLEIIHTLIAAVEARDPNLNGHSKNVADLTMLIYEYLPKEYQKSIDKKKLEYAAILHDIGKLGIPEYILNKNSSLNKEEYEEIKKHPMIGKNILSSTDYFKEFSDWILYHHERYDGNGYYNIPGEKIPMASKIIALADTYSAITMNRSYREAESYEQAVKILKECRNTQFDGKLVDLFLSIPKEKIINCSK